MKKAFTLVELLIVVVVIVTLMSITFRLSSVGSESEHRNRTVARLNRLENCLSGYYAAFGTYPPVPVHGSRNIYAKVDTHGIQSDDGEENTSIWGWTTIGEEEERKAWDQVKATCKSQPVDCRFPYPDTPEYRTLIESVSKALQKKAADSKDLSEERKKVLSSPFGNGMSMLGNFDSSETDWRKIQLFKFGLMSYLLPRYQIMMNSKEELFNGNFAQWEVNNAMPCDPMTGVRFQNWKDVRTRAQSDRSRIRAEVANIPSEAVCARWMPNLEGIVCCNHNFSLYGVSIKGDIGASDLRADNLNIEVYSPDGGDSTSGQYILDGATVLDGWWNEFYYYSAPPYQSYTLWSGGKNNRTFPPWISRKSLDSKAAKCVGLWVEDDIVRMSN